MTNAHRRHGVLLGLVAASAMSVFLALAGCGQATLTPFKPCPTPTPGTLDITFKGGVMQVFQSKDCYNGTTCHNKQNPGGPASGLALGGDTPDNIYANIMAGGAQGHGPGDYDVAVGSTAGKSLLLVKPLQTSPTNHTGGKQFPSETDVAYQTIFLWASNGALNNGGSTGC